MNNEDIKVIEDNVKIYVPQIGVNNNHNNGILNDSEDVKIYKSNS